MKRISPCFSERRQISSMVFTITVESWFTVRVVVCEWRLLWEEPPPTPHKAQEVCLSGPNWNFHCAARDTLSPGFFLLSSPFTVFHFSFQQHKCVSFFLKHMCVKSELKPINAASQIILLHKTHHAMLCQLQSTFLCPFIKQYVQISLKSRLWSKLLHKVS